MIIESLVQYYEALAAAGTLDRPGWSPVGVSYALELDEAGALLQIIPRKSSSPREKKPSSAPKL